MRLPHPTFGQVILSLGVVCLLAASALAHPGSGLAVDKNGQVYFLDTGSGLWKIDAQGKLIKVDRNRFHWLALDEMNALANTRLPSGATGDFVKVGANPGVILASDWPIAIDQNGNLYYPAGSPGSLRMTRTSPSGATSVFATLPATATGVPLPHVNGIAVGPDGAIYYTEDTAIRRITPQGVISVVATIPALVGGPSIPGIASGSRPLLRALQVDAKGMTYVAAEGDGRVLKITPDGQVNTLLQTHSPWAPTAVALFGGDVYVLEFLHTDRDERTDWFPRVSKIAPDGKQTILATIDQMPGARSSVPPRPLAVDLKASTQGSSDCRLEWNAPALGAGVEASLGAVSHYRVDRRTRRPAGAPTEEWGAWQITTTDPSATIKGLDRVVEYDFRVVAINAGGPSVPSNVATWVLR